MFEGKKRPVGEIPDFNPEGDVFVNVNEMCTTMTVRDKKSFYLVKLNVDHIGTIKEKTEFEEKSLILTQCKKYVYPKVEEKKKKKKWYICDIE